MNSPDSGERSGDGAGVVARRLAIEAVRRIDDENAFANLLVPSMLRESGLDQRDRNLVTEIAYGSTRMRRAVDWLCDRYLETPPPPALRASLRVGAYQLAFMRVPAHAAVSSTVSASSKRNRGVVNAILRRVSKSLPIEHWPSEGVRLSVPDWLLERLSADLGADDALGAIAAMNRAPAVTERDDGYIQDRASQAIVEVVGAGPSDRVLDLCAAPGGKATGVAGRAGFLVANDLRVARAGLIATNISELGVTNASVVVGDGTSPPFKQGSFDRVLVDAPCSGLGVLARRPDARWRVNEADVAELSNLQVGLVGSAAVLVRPGGELVYSVCTMTTAETLDVATTVQESMRLEPLPVDDSFWKPHGTGGLVLPQHHETDGMAVFRWRVPSTS